MRSSATSTPKSNHHDHHPHHPQCHRDRRRRSLRQRREEPGRRLPYRLQARPGRQRQPLCQARRATPLPVVGAKARRASLPRSVAPRGSSATAWCASPKATTVASSRLRPSTEGPRNPRPAHRLGQGHVRRRHRAPNQPAGRQAVAQDRQPRRRLGERAERPCQWPVAKPAAKKASGPGASVARHNRLPSPRPATREETRVLPLRSASRRRPFPQYSRSERRIALTSGSTRKSKAVRSRARTKTSAPMPGMHGEPAGALERSRSSSTWTGSRARRSGGRSASRPRRRSPCRRSAACRAGGRRSAARRRAAPTRRSPIASTPTRASTSSGLSVGHDVEHRVARADRAAGVVTRRSTTRPATGAVISLRSTRRARCATALRGRSACC